MASQTYSVFLSGTNSHYLDVTISTTANSSSLTSSGTYSIAYRIAGSGSYYSYNTGNRLLVQINGTTYVDTSNICAIQLSSTGSKTIATGSFSVSHSSDGTCSFPVYVYFDQTQRSGNDGTISETFTCDSIQVTPSTYLQVVYARYQQSDGTWGNYSAVINAYYAVGATVSWSRAADTIYKVASISYTVSSANTKYVDVYRQTYVQTVNVAYQNADGTLGSYSTDSSTSYYYGATFSKTWGGDTTYKSTTLSYTVTGTATKYVDVYRNEYPIYFDSNGGLFTTSPQYYIYGGTTQLSKYRPTRSGHIFLGWGLNTDSTNATYSHQGNYTFDDSEPTLYAVWEKVNQDIYLYNDGRCYVSEFIEDESNGFGSGGRLCSPLFDESESENGTFEIGNSFVGISFVEGLPT